MPQLTILLGLSVVVAGCPAEQKAAPPIRSATRAAKTSARPAAATRPASRAARKPTMAAASKPATPNAGAGDTAAGLAVFKRTCANCHGLDGTGAAMRSMLPKIGNLTLAETHNRLDDAALTKLITEGRGKMPPLGSVLPADQIKAVISYVRTLKR